MDIHRSAVRYGLILSLLCLLVQPVGLDAQCMVASTSMGTGTQGGMAYRYGAKILSAAYQCTLTMQMNMIGCSPDPSDSTSFLSGAAFTTATNPTCMWDCACGTVEITNVDLPVELMDFGIEGEESAATGDDHREAGDRDAP